MNLFAQTDNGSTPVNPPKNVLNVEMAYSLAKYGYDNSKPLYLITAAQTMIDNPIKGSLKQNETATTNKVIDLNPKKLLADAKEMAKSDNNLVAMITTMEATVPSSRGGGNAEAVYEYIDVKAGTEDVFTQKFIGGQPVNLVLIGDGMSDLDLYVMDESGKQIAFDKGDVDHCRVTFMPSKTGNYKIKIKSLGAVKNVCMVMTM
jgi:hypothetical protein